MALNIDEAIRGIVSGAQVPLSNYIRRQEQEKAREDALKWAIKQALAEKKLKEQAEREEIVKRFRRYSFLPEDTARKMALGIVRTPWEEESEKLNIEYKKALLDRLRGAGQGERPSARESELWWQIKKFEMQTDFKEIDKLRNELEKVGKPTILTSEGEKYNPNYNPELAKVYKMRLETLYNKYNIPTEELEHLTKREIKMPPVRTEEIEIPKGKSLPESINLGAFVIKKGKAIEPGVAERAVRSPYFVPLLNRLMAEGKPKNEAIKQLLQNWDTIQGQIETKIQEMKGEMGIPMEFESGRDESEKLEALRNLLDFLSRGKEPAIQEEYEYESEEDPLGILPFLNE